jgi:SAM-dependent methyltransferase
VYKLARLKKVTPLKKSDEEPAKSFKDHFSTVSSGYAAYRPSYPSGLAEFLASTAPRRGLAWDAGCGSGQLSVLLGDRFERVIATDASAEQIRQAQPHPSVEYRNAPAEASGLPPSSVDLAVAAQAAHWFDLQAYYDEVRRVSRPHAVVALVSYGNPKLEGAVDQLVERFYSEPLGRFWPPERRLVEDEYRSLLFPFDEIKPPAFRMRVHWNLAQLAGYIETWSALRAMEKAVGRAEIEDFYRELAREWGPESQAREVTWTLALRVGKL